MRNTLNYNAGSIGDVLRDLKARGTCRGSSGIEPEDVELVDAALRREYFPAAESAAGAALGDGGFQPFEPSAPRTSGTGGPSWCDRADRERLNPNGFRPFRYWKGKDSRGRAR